MIRVQVVLTPAESKRLICQGLIEFEPVRKALTSGIVAVHPSSTTYGLKEMITGEEPDGVWMAGMIIPRGTCIEGRCQQRFEEDQYNELSVPKNFPFTWVFREKRFETGAGLSHILSEMGEGDVYIKGVNAIDTHGKTGVLLASLAGGTIGRVIKAQKRQGFHLICTAGLEKLIPGTLKEVAKETGRPVTQEALGIPCGLLPIDVAAFTEREAFQVLSGVEAIPVAGGGVAGAEGSIMLVLKGEKEKVKNALEIVKNIKGTKPPRVMIPQCKSCHSPGCHYAGHQVAWG